jgi:hypothetical protein
MISTLLIKIFKVKNKHTIIKFLIKNFFIKPIVDKWIKITYLNIYQSIYFQFSNYYRSEI